MIRQFKFKFYHPLILLVFPLIGNLVSTAVNWSWFDFMVMGSLLLGLGLGTSFVLKKFKQSPNRLSYISAVIIVFLLIWAELAVGVIGSPLAGH
jgi:hypothetical protein